MSGPGAPGWEGLEPVAQPRGLGHPLKRATSTDRTGQARRLSKRPASGPAGSK